MIQYEVSLVPSWIVAQISSYQFVNENQLIVEQTVWKSLQNKTEFSINFKKNQNCAKNRNSIDLLISFNGPLTMLPRMIVLRIHPEYLFGEFKLFCSIV